MSTTLIQSQSQIFNQGCEMISLDIKIGPLPKLIARTEIEL